MRGISLNHHHQDQDESLVQLTEDLQPGGQGALSEVLGWQAGRESWPTHHPADDGGAGEGPGAQPPARQPPRPAVRDGWRR